jgi:acetoin:2,6-dichlorophenolindophenol oxidoreductase subunit alpha
MSVVAKAPSLVGMYESIKRIREFEETAISLFQDGIVPGFTHTYIGQEAVAVGVCSALTPGDRVASNHRGHGHIIARGADTSRMLAEILGKKGGYLQGMGGELHIMDASINIIGANGIVGAGIPIAVGAALSDQMQGNDNVTVSFFGDGATSEGYFAEAMNLAAIWQLPIVFVCENNMYGEFTPAAEVCAGVIYKRAEGYGIPGVEVDGQDVVAVRDCALEAVERARSGGGPTLIEAKTYRWYGHFYGEEAMIGSYSYRSDEEVADWKQNRDPVTLTRRRVLDEGVADEAELARVDQEIAEEMKRASEFAQSSPLPPAEQALDFIFAEPVYGPAQA